jgi:hypothetical protein
MLNSLVVLTFLNEQGDFLPYSSIKIVKNARISKKKLFFEPIRNEVPFQK